MGQKIAVLVLTGFLGAGKTTLLNRLLTADGSVVAQAAGSAGVVTRGDLDKVPDRVNPAGLVVLVNEVGEIGLDHHLIRHVSDRVAVLPSGCICCSVKGELVNALRDLFMAAVQRKIRPFNHVIIETTGIADPSAIRYTLSFERFLADRYRYVGCVTVVDTVHIEDNYAVHPEVQAQLAMADGLVLTKLDQCTPDAVRKVGAWLAVLLPQARCVQAGALTNLGALFDLGAVSVFKPRLFGKGGGRMGAALASPHGSLDVASMQWPGRVSRAALVKALAAALEEAGSTLLRFKGVFLLENGERVVVHAVHGTAYPPETLLAETNTLPDCAAVAILRGGVAEEFLAYLRARLQNSTGSGLQK
ncbi:MAG: GTP-binding protein [Pusillimonas sp.]